MAKEDITQMQYVPLSDKNTHILTNRNDIALMPALNSLGEDNFITKIYVKANMYHTILKSENINILGD